MNYYIASCSCGKDSLAMVLRLIEEKKPLDEIVFYDTDMEFKCIYDNWLLLKLYAGKHGIKCTRLEPKCSFLYTMFEKPVNIGKPNEHKGYSWCGGCCRWGTTAKLKALDEYCQAKNAKCYVGIAADEIERLIKERKPYKLFPLADWQMTERESALIIVVIKVLLGKKTVLIYTIYSTVFRVGVALIKIFGSYTIFGNTCRNIGRD